MYLKVDIDHHDWASIKKEESAETFENYKDILGLFVGVTILETNLTQVFRLEMSDLLSGAKVDNGQFTMTLKV